MNFSEDGNINYRIDCSSGSLYNSIKEDLDTTVISKFKLNKVLSPDLLWVLDENKKVRHFSEIKELIAYFVDFRLNKYKDRKSLLVKLMEEKYKANCNLVKFIELVCSNKLKITNRKKDDIAKDMQKYDLDIKLLSTAISKCTVEEKEELLQKNKEIKEELEYIKKTTEVQMYINDLDTLRSELTSDFK